MGIDPTIVTFLLVFVPVVLIVAVAFLLIKCTELHVSRAQRVIARSLRSSDREQQSSPPKSEHSDGATLVGSTHDVEKGKAGTPGPSQEA